MLRQYDTVDRILSHFKVTKGALFINSFKCAFIQNHKFSIAALTWSKQIKHFLPLQ